jgi:nucleoside 2-deoxyribosyltransferase
LEIYLAGPLFSEAERTWAISLSKKLTTGLHAHVFWPGNKITEAEIRTWGRSAPTKIFEKCVEGLEECSEANGILVAILDGTSVDDGTAWEVGYFYCREKNKRSDPPPIYGIRTDTRMAGETEFSKVNAMIEAACRHIVIPRDDQVGSGKSDQESERLVQRLVDRIRDDFQRVTA